MDPMALDWTFMLLRSPPLRTCLGTFRFASMCNAVKPKQPLLGAVHMSFGFRLFINRAMLVHVRAGARGVPGRVQPLHYPERQGPRP